jgi:RHS repeat-associated protein
MDRLSDDKTGLIYANARYLDPNTSRFLSFDPFEGYDNKPISLHRYLYAYQNPGRYVDKDGEEALQIGAVVGTAFFLSETVAYLSSDPDGNGQSVASEIGTATAQFVDDVKTAAVDYYARQAVALLSAGVMEGEVSPNTALVHDVPERGSYDHPADTDLNRPRIYTTPIVESLPERMETPYHDKSPEEYILSTPSRAGDIDSGVMLSEKSSDDEEIYARGSWRKSTLVNAEKASRLANDGKLLCSTCGKDVSEKITIETKNGPQKRRGYDLDHYPITWAERITDMKNWSVKAIRKDVIDEYNKKVRVQCPECNQSHQFEGIKGEFQ